MGRSSVRFPRDRLPEALQMSEQIPLAHSESCKPSAQCYSRKNGVERWERFWFEREKTPKPRPNTHTNTVVLPTSFHWALPPVGLSWVGNLHSLNGDGRGLAWSWSIERRDVRLSYLVGVRGRQGRIETENQEQTELSSRNCVSAFVKAVFT